MSMQVLSEYLEFLEIEKGLSENTLEAYRRDIGSFLDYCFKNDIQDIQKIQRNHINN